MKKMARPLAFPAGMMILLLSGGCYTVQDTPPTPQQKADELARGITLASGAAVWPRINTIAFTFVVRDGGEVKVSRSHVWNVKAGTDTVTAGDKTMTININKPESDDPNEAEMFKAWTNDTYWLAAPLKLFDPGVTREYLGHREIAGKTYDVLHLSFKGVGLTPDDHYNMYIDPYTSLVASWDYMPDPEKKMWATWEQYRHPSGLKLATFHQMGSKTIAMENLSVTSE